jgi:hypothetical protein
MGLCLLNEVQRLISRSALFQIEANDARSVPIRLTGELQLSALIADRWWRVDLMNSDILEEEARAGVFDVRQPRYPLLALNLRARRDNLVSTIYALEKRAKAAQVAPSQLTESVVPSFEDRRC